MISSVVNIVIILVVFGLIISYFFGKKIRAVRDVFPAISATAIVIILLLKQ